MVVFLEARRPSLHRRLKNGNTLISNQFDDQVIGVNSSGNIVFSQGQIAVPGNGFNELNAPYDAKVVGDYTGLTAP
ncbi:MAG: hypothetical protein WAM89_03435 [Terriglobales bacterium]